MTYTYAYKTSDGKRHEAAKAVELEERHKAEIEAASGKDECEEAAAVLRTEARNLFKDILKNLPDEDEQLEAKRLYGELMILADHSELDEK